MGSKRLHFRIVEIPPFPGYHYSIYVSSKDYLQNAGAYCLLTNVDMWAIKKACW